MTERCRLCDEPAELGDLCFECEDRAITDFTASPCPLFFDDGPFRPWYPARFGIPFVFFRAEPVSGLHWAEWEALR